MVRVVVADDHSLSSARLFFDKSTELEAMDAALERLWCARAGATP